MPARWYTTPIFSFCSRQSRRAGSPYLLTKSVKAYGLSFANIPLRHSSVHAKQPGSSLSKEHLLFSHHSLSGQSSDRQPPQRSFSEQRQQASPHRAIPSSLFNEAAPPSSSARLPCGFPYLLSSPLFFLLRQPAILQLRLGHTDDQAAAIGVASAV